MKSNIATIFVFLLLLLAIPATANHHNEEDKPSEQSEFTPALRLASIAKYKNWDFQLSSSGEFRDDSADF